MAQPAEKARFTVYSPDPVLVRIEGVFKHFPVGGMRGAVVRAVDGVDLEIRRGETLGLVGESGCGKSTLARLITALMPVTRGKIVVDGQDITRLRGGRLRRVRGKMQIIFQDPFASLDPRMTVGDILQEPLDNFAVGSGRDRRRRGQELLRLVGLHPEVTQPYSLRFSGGEGVRISVRRAPAGRPPVIVCG